MKRNKMNTNKLKLLIPILLMLLCSYSVFAVPTLEQVFAKMMENEEKIKDIVYTTEMDFMTMQGMPGMPQRPKMPEMPAAMRNRFKSKTITYRKGRDRSRTEIYMWAGVNITVINGDKQWDYSSLQLGPANQRGLQTSKVSEKNFQNPGDMVRAMSQFDQERTVVKEEGDSYVITLFPKESTKKTIPLEKIIFHVNKTTFMPSKIMMVAGPGQIMEFNMEYIQIKGIWVLKKTTGMFSMTYTDIKVNEGLSDELFTKSSLTNLKTGDAKPTIRERQASRHRVARRTPREVSTVDTSTPQMDTDKQEPGAGSAVSYQKKTIQIDKSTYAINVVTVKLSEVKIKVALANEKVGHVESLEDMANRYNALAAINGSFFEAYTDDAIKNPHNSLKTDGRYVHVGNIGSLLYFNDQNEADINELPVEIIGGRNGSYIWPNKWYAYWLNRKTNAANVTIFTPAWGDETGMDDATQVVVDNGYVTNIGYSSQHIPKSGYVIYIKDINDSAFEKFEIGQRVDYKVISRKKFQQLPQIKEAVGAGPTLVRDGEIHYEPEKEGFIHDKILMLKASRSAVGITSDQELLLVTTTARTEELAYIMKELGAVDAMNLDGGASSGLWYKGNYIRPSGRLISNALLILSGKD